MSPELPRHLAGDAVRWPQDTRAGSHLRGAAPRMTASPPPPPRCRGLASRRNIKTRDQGSPSSGPDGLVCVRARCSLPEPRPVLQDGPRRVMDSVQLCPLCVCPAPAEQSQQRPQGGHRPLTPLATGTHETRPASNP